MIVWFGWNGWLIFFSNCLIVFVCWVLVRLRLVVVRIVVWRLMFVLVKWRLCSLFVIVVLL